LTERIPHPRDYEAEAQRRRLMVLGGVVVLALVITAYFVLRDDGEGHRDAYCIHLKALDQPGIGFLETAAQASRKQIETLVDLAPASVEPAWTSFSALLLNPDADPQQLQIDAARFEPSVRKILDDAGEKCGFVMTP
jgi:hypothetical protein